jgi:hypothetical protein
MSAIMRDRLLALAQTMRNTLHDPETVLSRPVTSATGLQVEAWVRALENIARNLVHEPEKTSKD